MKAKIQRTLSFPTFQTTQQKKHPHNPVHTQINHIYKFTTHDTKIITHQTKSESNLVFQTQTLHLHNNLNDPDIQNPIYPISD